jgi:hypothetical protein
MNMWSKNGSYPQYNTDGTPGWVEVPDKPEPVEGKEILWLNNEWVIRDPMPERRPGYVWKWIHDWHEWKEYAAPIKYSIDPNLLALMAEDSSQLTDEQISALTNAQNVGL